MATKDEMLAELLTLDPSAQFEGLSHAELAKLLKDAKAKQASETKTPDSETKTPDSETKTPEAKQETKTPDSETKTPEAKQETKTHVVSRGQAVSSLKGLLLEDDEIKPEYLSGGEESFKTLKTKKIIRVKGD